MLASYGHKADLPAFLREFGSLVEMDPRDPVQLDLGRYVGSRGEVVTMTPTMKDRSGTWNRGV
jgi:hypothetical protein